MFVYVSDENTIANHMSIQGHYLNPVQYFLEQTLKMKSDITQATYAKILLKTGIILLSPRSISK
jgi:hypothetical protein